MKEDVEKIINRIDKNIDNIEQLGADARFYYNKEQYSRLRIQIESIIKYSKKILNELETLGS